MQQYCEPIERFFNTGGTQSTGGYDGTVVYDAWALLNEQGFTKRVPSGFVAGSRINLLLSEVTDGIYARHKWQADVSLIRTDADTPAAAAAQTFSAEFVSPDVAGRETNRSIPITDESGLIDGVAPAASDILNVKLSRIAATTHEDGNAIKVITYGLATIIDQATVSGCLGRVGKIIDRVFKLFNEIDDEHLNRAEILDYLNQCSEEIAKREYWRTTGTITALDGIETYDLLAEMPNYERVLQLRWNGGTRLVTMLQIQTRGEYERHKFENRSTDRHVAFVDSNVLYIWPVPVGTPAGTIDIYYAEYPGDLGCTESYTPEVPVGHDMLYVYFAMVQALQKDIPSGKASRLLAVYQPKLDMEMNRLFGQQIGQGFSIIPG